MLKKFSGNLWILVGMVLGLVLGSLDLPLITNIGTGISEIFLKFLRLLGVPLIFLAIFSTISEMTSLKEVRSLGKKTLFYTLFTTLISASIALALYTFIQPASYVSKLPYETTQTQLQAHGYLSFLGQIVPDNLFGAFTTNNVLGIAFLALIFGAATLFIPEKQKIAITTFFSGLLAVFNKVTQAVVSLMPIAVFGFSILLAQNMKGQKGLISMLGAYLATVILANLIQAFVVLPLLLKQKKIPVWSRFKEALPTLTIAFFSKSSSATLPFSIKATIEKMKLSPRVAKFILPLCSIINMNGCAAFILITFLFVSSANGVVITPVSSILWVIIATLAAFGNAGVPLGCFFLTSALLAGQNIPLYLMGLILPFYTFLDMIETALNIWSDISVTMIVDKELQEEEKSQEVLS